MLAKLIELKRNISLIEGKFDVRDLDLHTTQAITNAITRLAKLRTVAFNYAAQKGDDAFKIGKQWGVSPRIVNSALGAREIPRQHCTKLKHGVWVVRNPDGFVLALMKHTRQFTGVKPTVLPHSFPCLVVFSNDPNDHYTPDTLPFTQLHFNELCDVLTTYDGKQIVDHHI